VRLIAIDLEIILKGWPTLVENLVIWLVLTLSLWLKVDVGDFI
jgi:hypothetical protein